MRRTISDTGTRRLTRLLALVGVGITLAVAAPAEAAQSLPIQATSHIPAGSGTGHKVH
jgi:hypothetical protein